MIPSTIHIPIPIVRGLASLALAALAACAPVEEELAPGEVPAPYAGMENPLAGDEAAIAAGETLWGERCTGCHDAGLEHEDGEEHGADYLFWRIAEGGGFAPFDSEMPSFKDDLSEDQLWQIVSYLEHAAELAHLHDH